jgi:hypothetical protein
VTNSESDGSFRCLLVCLLEGLIFIFVQDGYRGLYPFLSNGSWRDLQLGCHNQVSSTSFTWSVGITSFSVVQWQKLSLLMRYFDLSSVGIGLAFGIASVLWLGFIFNDTVIEISLTLAVSYIAYYTVSCFQTWVRLVVS